MDYDLSKYEEFEAAANFTRAFHASSNFPYAYAYATFLTLSGAILGRNASLWHRVTYYPNFYTCLVGPSGTNRKSTIMGFGVNTLPMYLERLPTLTTWLGFLDILNESEGRALIHLDELATVMATAKKEYSRELINQLTEVYSNPPTVGNYSKKSRIKVEEPSVSILSASTIEWLQQTVTMGDILGGFGNRMSWVLGDPRLENRDPEPPGEFDWGPIEDSPRHLYFTADAKETYTQYEQQFYQEQNKLSPVARVLGERIPEKVLKVALIYSAWEGEDSVEEYAILHGIQWADYLQQCVSKIAPQFEPPDRRVLAAIRGGIRSKKALSKALGHVYTNRQLKEVIDGLKWDGSITVDGDKIGLL